MNILVSDASRFGIKGSKKESELSLLNLYLITNGEKPNSTSQAVLVSELNLTKAQAVAKSPVVLEHVNVNSKKTGNKKTSIWRIDPALSRTTRIVQWIECNDINDDYYVSETQELKNEVTNTFWGNTLQKGLTTCLILGVNPYNYRSIMLPIQTNENKPAVETTACKLAFWKQIIKDGGPSNITISTAENPNENLDRKIEEVGDGFIDEYGYIIEELPITSTTAKLITKQKDSFTVRYKGERRHCIQEKARGKIPFAFNLKHPLLRVKVPTGYKYILYRNLSDNRGLFECLLVNNPSLFQEELKSIDENTIKNGLTLQNIIGKNGVINAHPKLVEEINKLDIEILTLNSTWEPINFSEFPKEITNIIPDDILDKPLYNFKYNYSIRTFGLHHFSRYLQHPLDKKHLPVREAPEHYYWMKWCLNNDITFIKHD
ncbi:hypothetical protein VFMJ11_B0003 (plasmid) [Aliivibrio fischeri MJ11]|uniref:Uncharacterized protein n=1 Tax=Aliivibrio fischeri (strain MJ11) TaxID=388396 RepID=B5EVU6_ALIFM|nr:hypothetical protein [Aliivibrio fischeri]ACH64636.1 hypothetical protein VFMJ11_B0003 [Aliivibrio fischeri MJ11]